LDLTELPVNIAIIGGGFCGIVTAVHLLRHNKTGIHLHIINKGPAFGKGVAYDPHTCSLLLNVPNGRMSAFADKPDDFIDWLNANYPNQDNSPTTFSTRRQYGEYLLETWNEALNNIPLCNSVTVYDDLADNITEIDDVLQIHLRQHPAIIADAVILATGNAKPRVPNGIHPSFTKSKHYFADPWKSPCITNTTDSDVLIIGNGLTTADTIIGLVENGYQQTIHSVSPHGYRLNPWVDDKAPYTAYSFSGLPSERISLYQLLKTFNKHRRIANNSGQSIYPLIDSLRPHIQRIWLHFTTREKQQFIRHLKPYWEKVRHRLPVDMHQKIDVLRKSGLFQPCKGSIISVKELNGVCEVVLNCSGELKTIRVSRIINCTGPDPDITRQGNALLNNLVQKETIIQGPCGMGINADHKTGRVIAAGNFHKTNLYVIGSNLKGVLWESTAVPELRVQAQNIAEVIINGIEVRRRHVVETA